MLGLIENWFHPVRASQDYQRQDYFLLFLIVAVGTWLRFWHLGNVGLHGDEDIMALAARGIVEQGSPILPSGMYYDRVLLHSYVLAWSTMLFGDNEWALRLPSAIVGSLCGLLAFFMGRRFLDPKPNLALVAVMTFLPAMIDVSLTARMYVFFVASLMGFAILIFRWERDGKLLSFALACLVWLLAVHLQALAIFAAPLFLFPGLARRSLRQLMLGTFALVSAFLVSEFLSYLASHNYPNESDRLDLPEETIRSPVAILFQGHLRLSVAVAIAAAIAVLILGTARLERRKQALPATLLLAIGTAACVLLQYHIGAIALLFGSVLWLRAERGRNSRLLVIGVVIGLMAIAQFYALHQTGEFPGRAIIGAFIGMPSIWPTLRFVSFSPVGAAILAVTVGIAAYRLALGHKVPEHFLFFGIAVWAPLVAIGLFSWNVAERYTIGVLPFFLLVVLAGVNNLLQGTGYGSRLLQRPAAAAVATVLLVAGLINPAAAWQAARNDYRDHPDHKGAAEFIKGMNPGAADIFVAEDAINQTYYLGRVDYHLQSAEGARDHSVLRNGTLYDQYTGAPVIVSGLEFQAILDRETAGNVYVIGDGQVSENLRRRNRADGIAEVLKSDRLEVIYLGRDQRTTVWKRRRPREPLL